jgi:hypothetical protein
MLYTLENAPNSNYSPRRCHVRVVDIAEMIALIDPGYDESLPPQVKGELLRMSDGGLRTIRSEGHCSLPLVKALNSDEYIDGLQ